MNPRRHDHADDADDADHADHSDDCSAIRSAA
jgi:hypothetical protein